MYLFADDAKMYRDIKNVADKDKLQRKFCRVDKQMASIIKYKQMQNFISTS